MKKTFWPRKERSNSGGMELLLWEVPSGIEPLYTVLQTVA